MPTDPSSVFGDVIYAYTRTQALSDGILIDATTLAKEAGFVFPVALTDHLYHSIIVPALDLIAEGQSIEGRLWDALQILRYTIATSKDDSYLQFSVLFVMTPGALPVPIDLIAVCGPGDTGDPVLTLMLPGDD